MNADIFDRLCDTYPAVSPTAIAALLDRATEYVDDLRFTLADGARSTVLTLCALKGLDPDHAWAYEESLWSILACYAQEGA